MEVLVNGASRRLPAGTTVAELVGTLGRSPRGLAVAVNQEVVVRSRWTTTRLGEGDRVEVLAAAQGG
ncbi:MAG: sulfur carrier protein ThiS [Candidatus Dormibacteria bacterium]